MYKLAVIGDYDSIYGFAALGLDIYPTEDAKEADQTIKRLADIGYGVIYITEELASKVPETIRRYDEQMMPAIILIPGVKGNTGAGIQGVKDSVEKAVGSDILFGSE